MFRFGILFTFVSISSNLFAFTPGKWSHTDRYVLGSEKGGPTQELVKNSDGKIIYSANYKYDESGKLVQEFYIDSDGKGDGQTKFTYLNGKIQREELFNKNGKIVETKSFFYNPNGILSVVELKDEAGKLVLNCIISSWGENGLVRDAQTDWTNTKEKERFSVVKDNKNPSLFQQNIFNEDKQQVASTIYTYDEQGKLLSRMNVQGNLERLNRLIWDKNNRLQQLTFHVKQGDKWTLEKTHELVYGK
ncbi:hypothetical protein CH373_00720 [Leptospira perolatii]|uniref:Uncharacterized protein n=1 Tax=Leptospira perolatii TaxID=2023191 RepID=A0A2M9ZRM4_9LEPT|nr:hypothetical protein [Leptospira perolatii]PJZ71079.1 hypothetical protein CH360_00720 [Leptospira perolatii]PJZ74611.1 hypothetical protein CH373_00720 [Leptospira perolatii]